MAFAMGLAYLVYEKLTESRVLLIAYLLTLLTSLGSYHVLQGKHWFGKHLTYRSLAETLRARFYLRLAGADHGRCSDGHSRVILDELFPRRRQSRRFSGNPSQSSGTARRRRRSMVLRPS